MNDDTPRERLARLETHFEHLSTTVTAMDQKVGDIHSTIMQAKGANKALSALGRGTHYLIVAMAAATSILTVFVTKFFPFLSSVQR